MSGTAAATIKFVILVFLRLIFGLFVLFSLWIGIAALFYLLLRDPIFISISILLSLLGGCERCV